MQRTPGADPGTLWHNGVWPRHGNCVVYRVMIFYRIKYPQLAVCYLGSWMFRGGCWLYVLCVRDQVVLDATQVHRVGKVYKLCRVIIYPDSRACGLRHAMVESQ